METQETEAVKVRRANGKIEVSKCVFLSSGLLNSPPAACKARVPVDFGFGKGGVEDLRGIFFFGGAAACFPVSDSSLESRLMILSRSD